MRTYRLALAALLASASFAAPADAAGACVDTSPGSAVCVPGSTCAPGDTVVVLVIGTGAGIARCGGVTAFCDTPLCTDSARASRSGTLSCSVDPFTAPAVAVCLVVPTQR